jgi:hypothetical protein
MKDNNMKEYFSNIGKNHFKDPKFLKKWYKSLNIHPNKKEDILIKLLKELKLDYKFTGDFSIWIDGKNPDFINEGTKKIIEFYGEYWHKNEKIDGGINRINHFKK